MNYSIIPGCAASDRYGIWFIDREYTMLFFWDKSSKEITKAKRIIGLDYKQEGAFLDIKCVGTKVVMAPNISNEIIIYDIEKDHFDSILFQNPCRENFRKIYEVNNNVLLVPNHYDCMVWLDLCGMNLLYSNRWNIEEKERFIQSAYMSGKYIYAAINDEIILRYNADIDSWDTQYTFSGMKISAVIVIEDSMYLFDVNSTELLLYDMKSKKIVRKQKIGTKSLKLYHYFDKYIWLDEVYGLSYWIFDMNLILKKRGKKGIKDETKGYASCFASDEFDDVIYEMTTNGFINVYDKNLIQTTYEMNMNYDVKNIIEENSIKYINSKSCLDKESQTIYESRLIGIDELVSVIC